MQQLGENDIQRMIYTACCDMAETKIVYKYSNLDVGIGKILTEQTLKFSNPIEFNDPFDCNINLLPMNPSKELLDETLSKYRFNRAIRKEIKKRHSRKEYLHALIQERSRYKLSCFSKTNSNVLMWSHYSDKHQGICIGFNFPYKYHEKFILVPVRYLDKIIPLDGTSNVIRTILYWITTKSTSWEYEQEIRAIAKSNTTSLVEFIDYEKEIISEIIFGCKVKKEVINKTIKELRNADFDIKSITFKQMSINPNTFQLQEQIIKI